MAYDIDHRLERKLGCLRIHAAAWQLASLRASLGKAKGLIKILLEPGAKPERGKVSEMISEFAQPLLYADPEGPPSIDILRSAMMLAMICWNLPVYEAGEAGGNPFAGSSQASARYGDQDRA